METAIIDENAKEGFVEPSLFEFHNPECRVTFDVFNPDPQSQPRISLKVCSLPNTDIRFSFRPKEGLVRVLGEETTQQKNTLGRLIAIEDLDLASLEAFFDENGFLYPCSEDSYTEFSLDEIAYRIRRMKATVNLMSAIGEGNAFDKILSNAAFLSFGKESIGGNLSGIPALHTLLEKADNLTEVNAQRVKKKDYKYEVYDSLFRDYFSVTVKDYNSMREGDGIEGFEGSSAELFRKLFFLYFNGVSLSKPERQIIEFFFRYQFENGAFRPIQSTDIDLYARKKQTVDVDRFREALISVSRHVLTFEINNNIKDVRPVYSVEKLAPDWKVSSLIQAMYFSLFYMKPGLQIYRKCGNPTCKRDRYFLVNTSAIKKKYCCDECRNAANQRILRDRRNKENE